MKPRLDSPLLRSADPANNKIVRLFFLESPLNPFARDRVKIVGATLYGDLPNAKAMAGFNMLAEAKRLGKLDGIHTLVVPTSGNFGSVVGMLGPEFGVENTLLYVKKDAPPGKIHTSAILPGVSIFSYDPSKGQNGLRLAREKAMEPGFYLVNQYEEWSNVEGHFGNTGPAIWNETQGLVTVLVAAAGSGGTLGGSGLYLKQQNRNIATVRAVVAPGEEIPAGRTIKQITDDVTIPFPPGTFDFTLECRRKDALRNALALGTQVHARPGPTSGEAHQVAIDWVAQTKQAGDLDRFRNVHGDVYVVVLFPDSIELYAERLTGSLDFSNV